MNTDRNDLAYWFPILESSGVPVPRTKILTTDVALINLLDGEMPAGYDAFMVELRAACDHFGYPCFLRTGQTSGKHDWDRTCFVADPEKLGSHVVELVDFSAMADFIGLSTRTWVVREFLELEAYFTAFRGMPVAREFRCFFRDGEILCLHPYWPDAAVENPSCEDWREKLQFINALGSTTEHNLRRILNQAIPFFDGAWSIDLAHLKTGGWVVTDMAEMDRSFHWPGCPNGPIEGPEKAVERIPLSPAARKALEDFFWGEGPRP
jgi:hypothetical protein